MNTIKQLVQLISMVGLLAGCGTLAPEGVYNGDKILYSSELSIRTSYDVLHAFVTWEKDNRQVLASVPTVKEYADYVRANAPRWTATAVAMRDAYANFPNDQTAGDLLRAVNVLREAMKQATLYMVDTSP